ncbi:probable WRKY transcription factor 70 [Triticum dicoccoides]|uniref:probable WRKY transcription factor 70 n=1 Tax=Triticum dicoccoides TaxID=85692 RepID=UPI001890175B|nr:probable WRKY transcription factor 70 [Triticum dicoccoides]
MAFGQEAIEQLSQELVSGYDLNMRLLALLRRSPLDRRGQERAAEMSQELSRVFMVSLFMLNSRESSRSVVDRMASPAATITEGSIDERAPAKDMRICGGEEVAPPRKGRENEVIKKEITASPYSDGYQWRKYGQKNIHKRKFARSYYKCMFSHDLGCRAKKTVQQQDSSSGDRPMFQVTYVHEHKCRQQTVPPGEATKSGHFDPQPQHAELDDDTMASCLAMVIGGAAPAGPSSSSLPSPPPVGASPSDLDGGHTPSPLNASTGLDTEISSGPPFAPLKARAAPSSSSPLLLVEAISSSDPAVYVPAGGGLSPSPDAMAMDDIYFPCDTLFSPVAARPISRSDDAPMAVARFTDTTSAWPHYS